MRTLTLVVSAILIMCCIFVTGCSNTPPDLHSVTFQVVDHDNNIVSDCDVYYIDPISYNTIQQITDENGNATFSMSKTQEYLINLNCSQSAGTLQLTPSENYYLLKLPASTPILTSTPAPTLTPRPTQTRIDGYLPANMDQLQHDISWWTGWI